VDGKAITYDAFLSCNCPVRSVWLSPHPVNGYMYVKTSRRNLELVTDVNGEVLVNEEGYVRIQHLSTCRHKKKDQWYDPNSSVTVKGSYTQLRGGVPTGITFETPKEVVDNIQAPRA
jgi:hypothetical protein